MITTADIHREEAIAAIKKAIVSLSEIIINDCKGSEDFPKSYKSDIVDVLDYLNRSKFKLDYHYK